MEKESNLSKKMFEVKHNGVIIKNVLLGDEVKEFIKLLKDKLFGDAIKPTDNEAIEIIDKLAGDELLK